MAQKHDCTAELRSVSLAATPARISAMHLFESHNQPLDALSLVDALAKQGVDRVTAFRILNTFVEKKILRKIELREGKSRYELVNRGDHHHFVCRCCDQIIDIKDTIVPQAIRKIEKQYDVTVTDHSLEFFGLCLSCQRKGSN